MINVHTPAELDAMRQAGRLMADLLNACCDFIQPGITTAEVDAFCRATLRTLGDGKLGLERLDGGMDVAVREADDGGHGGFASF